MILLVFTLTGGPWFGGGSTFYKVSNAVQEYLVDTVLAEADNQDFSIVLAGEFADGDYIQVIFNNFHGPGEVFLPVNEKCPPFSDL